MSAIRYKYKDINDTLGQLMNQVYESVDYAAQVCPEFDSPGQLFDWLKLHTTFKSDPPSTELLQTMRTLFENNFHGIPGAGDCDCFVIAAIACLKVNGFDDIGIVLTGRDRVTPVHIYLTVKDGQRWTAFDLTNKYYGEERKYPYRQILQI